jgi:glucose-1-phosphate adenylyltransferase
VKDSIVGIRSIVRSGAKIERSVIMGADHLEKEMDDSGEIPVGIGDNSTIINAIVDKNARIGKNVSIHGSRKLRESDGPGYAIRDGLVVVLKNAIIPDGARIGL